MTIHAIFENGVFRPVGKVDLPEPCEVEFEPRLLKDNHQPDHLARIYAILGQSFDTDDPNLAAKHDEHQP